MKGKQAILRYLETHRTFTAKDVATECGMTINCITKNAIDLERARKIVRVSKVWRTVTYRLATPEEQAGTARSCTNGIFSGMPEQSGYEASIDGLGEGRGMTRIRNFGWNRLKLATLSYEEINALEEQVKQEHACSDGIHMYDKAGRDKLDALSWAVYNKQKREAAQ